MHMHATLQNMVTVTRSGLKARSRQKEKKKVCDYYGSLTLLHLCLKPPRPKIECFVVVSGCMGGSVAGWLDGWVHGGWVAGIIDCLR